MNYLAMTEQVSISDFQLLANGIIKVLILYGILFFVYFTIKMIKEEE